MTEVLIQPLTTKYWLSPYLLDPSCSTWPFPSIPGPGIGGTTERGEVMRRGGIGTKIVGNARRERSQIKTRMME